MREGSSDLDYFLKEAVFLSLCCHPNIVKFHHSYRDQHSNFCIEMEHVAGCSLYETRINGNHEKIYKWIFQISSALAYIHELGIIHRDVKLANLLRD